MTSGVSQLGGWLDGLINWLKDAFTDFIITPIVTFITYSLGAILYGVQMGFFFVMDVVTCVFRKAAGLDVYYQNGQAVSGDLVMQFLQSSTVQAVFISILVAAIILLFITTFIAVLKVEFDEKDNSKGNIFKSALKAIAYFAIVPVVCFLGVIVSNFVLKMLDGATSRDAVSFSSQVFTASAYNANRVRSDAEFAQEIYNGRNGKFSYIPGIANLSAYDQGKIADLIDDAFRSGATPVADGGVASFTTVGDTGFGQKTRTFSSFDIGNYQLVFYFYNPLSYNYIIGYIASFMIIMILLKLLVGVMCRLYELTILFVLSPLAVSLMPLDGGDRYKAWRGAFIKRVFSAYGPILGLNLVFMILTLLQTVTLFPPDGINGLYNAIMQLIFIFTALVSIRSLVDLVTEMVGQGDALKAGEAVGKEAKKLGLKTVGQAGNLAMMGVNAGQFAYDLYQDAKAVKDKAEENGGLEDVSAGERLRALGQRVTHRDGREENQALQEKVNRRREQLATAKKELKEEGKLKAPKKKEQLIGRAKGFAEATPMWDMLKEDSKAAGKGAPIFGNIAKKFKDDEDAKKRKDAKDDAKLRHEIEEELANERARQGGAQSVSNSVGDAARGDDTDDDSLLGTGVGGTPPPGTGGAGGAGIGGLGGTPTSSATGDTGVGGTSQHGTGGAGGTGRGGASPDGKGGTGGPSNIDLGGTMHFSSADLYAENATVTDDTQEAEIDIGQSSTTSARSDINVGDNSQIDGDVDARDVDADAGELVDVLANTTLKIDDSGIKQELRSSAENANNTSRSIKAKLDEIAQSLDKTAQAIDHSTEQIKSVKKVVDKIQENGSEDESST